MQDVESFDFNWNSDFIVLNRPSLPIGRHDDSLSLDRPISAGWWTYFLRLAVPCFLILMAMTSAAVYNIISSDIEYFTGQLDKNAEVARERSASILKHADSTLAQTKLTYEQRKDWILPFEFKQGLDVKAIGEQDFLGTAVLSANSQVLKTTNLSMRMYSMKSVVNQHLKTNNEETILSCGTNTQFFLSKRVNDPSGDLAGVVTTELSGHRFNTATSNLSLDRNTQFTVSHGGHVHSLTDASHQSLHAEDASITASILKTVFNTQPVIEITKTLPHGFLVHAAGNLVPYVKQSLSEETGIFVLFLASLAFLVWFAARIATHQRSIQQQKTLAQYRATHDELTGLHNRRGLQEQYSALANIKSLALLFVDVDNFKAVNETLGHGVGDKFLQILAARLEKASKRGEIVTRLGGDEFAILVPLSGRKGSTHDEAITLAKHITFLMKQPIAVGDQKVRVSASVGVSYSPRHGSTLAELLRTADIALYATKDQGKDGARIFDSGMQNNSETKLILRQEIQHALDNNEYSVKFEPVYSVAQKLVTSCEAKVEWEREKLRAMIASNTPDVNAQIAGNKDLGLAIFEQVCRIAASASVQSFISIDMDLSLLVDSSVRGELASIVKEHKINPQRLILEVPADQIFARTFEAESALKAVQKLGFRIALDNVSSYGASLNALERIPVDKVKLSADIAGHISTSRDTVDVIEDLIVRSRRLKFIVAASGVQTKKQAQVLVRSGCHEIQGEFIGIAQTLDSAGLNSVACTSNNRLLKIAS